MCVRALPHHVLCVVLLAIALLTACAMDGAGQDSGPSAPAGANSEHPAGNGAENVDCAMFGIPELSPLANRQTVLAEDGTPVPGVELHQEFRTAETTGAYNVYTRGIDFSQPVGLVVRLHGDGAADFDEPDDMSACLAEVAASHNMVMVVPRTPDPGEDVTWWEDIPPNMAWLGELVHQEIIPKYGIDPQRVEWMGYSGGSEMLTFGVLASHPDWVTMGALMLGGGGAPAAMTQLPTPQQLQDLPLTWVTGLDDRGQDNDFDALKAAQAGADFYQTIGFQRVNRTWLPDTDHGNLPHAQALEDELTQLLAQR
ncbi:hypothetical protein QVA66_11380 [Staphylococcus chromogenes]|nr:hypothetical protein [Staphylococcus chromogenes]